MTPTALIEKAKEQGITLLLKKGALLWEGKDDPSPALLGLLRQHKPALRAYLKEQGLRGGRFLLKRVMSLSISK
jgi:hypothetical protein